MIIQYIGVWLSGRKHPIVGRERFIIARQSLQRTGTNVENIKRVWEKRECAVAGIEGILHTAKRRQRATSVRMRAGVCIIDGQHLVEARQCFLHASKGEERFPSQIERFDMIGLKNKQYAAILERVVEPSELLVHRGAIVEAIDVAGHKSERVVVARQRLVVTA